MTVGVAARPRYNLRARVALVTGSRLGPYEAIAAIGKGGMGESIGPGTPCSQGNEITIALNWFEELKRLVPAE